MVNKLSIILSLIRFYSPTGYLLLFFPCAFGLSIATKSFSIFIQNAVHFLIYSFCVRSLGCVINDLVDRNFDIHVARTKNRPLAVHAIDTYEFLMLFWTLAGICIFILFSMNHKVILTGLICVPMIIAYPFMKRITYLPQIFLAITFNIGSIIGYLSIANQISWNIVVLYIGCCFWTIAYDTVYGFADINDDRKIGIKSITMLVDSKMKCRILLTSCYVIFITLHFFSRTTINKCSFFLYALVIMILMIDIWSKDLRIQGNKFHFNLQNCMGMILLLDISMSYFL